MPRIYLRLNGSATGCVAKLPESFAELLEIANSKLLSNSEAKAARIFSASSDEILEEDFELIEHNDVLYVSTGEEWVAPPKEEAEVTSSSAALPQAAATSSAAVPAAAVPPLVDPAAVAAAVAAATSGEGDAAAVAAAVAAAAAGAVAAAPAAEEVEQEDPLEFMEEDLVPVTGIIDQRTTAEGTTEYLIVWQGYTAEENTWEDAEHVLDEGLIEEYETKMAALDALDVAGLRAKIAEAPSAVDAAGAPPVDGEACTDAAAAASGLSAASVAAEATEDLATLRAMAREAYAATVQDNALHANGTKRRAPPPRRKGKFDPLKMAERAREQARRAAEKAAERERKEAERQAREAQKAAEREERDRQKEAERLKREADRKAKEEEREAERLLRMAEKEAEREVREAEKAREAERKEAERMAKEAEREAKRQQLEAERLLKEAQKEEEVHTRRHATPPPLVYLNHPSASAWRYALVCSSPGPWRLPAP